MTKYWVIPKEDLEAFPHTWTKGERYEVVEKGDYFSLASNEGHVNFYNKVKETVLEKFSVVE